MVFLCNNNANTYITSSNRILSVLTILSNFPDLVFNVKGNYPCCGTDLLMFFSGIQKQEYVPVDYTYSIDQMISNDSEGYCHIEDENDMELMNPIESNLLRININTIKLNDNDAIYMRLRYLILNDIVNQNSFNNNPILSKSQIVLSLFQI